MRNSSSKQPFSSLLGIILIMLGACTQTHGQGQYDTTRWKFSNPKQFGFTVFDVDFFDNNNVIAVGGDGGIAKSTDGGTNWVYGPFTYMNAEGIASKATLSDVHYVTAGTAYAVGTGGCMAKTTDGGNTWNFIRTPLFINSKNINTCWFVNENTGYIGGQFNTEDSIPKLYFTHNGGSTWDSVNAPIGSQTLVGYVNNPSLPSQVWNISAKGKEIFRIEFADAGTGYIIGGGSEIYSELPSADPASCLPDGGITYTNANEASLVWKFKNGTLTDYSLSKEKLGYTGIDETPVNCATRYRSIDPQVQQYRALSIINDSTVVLMSFNNNIVVKIKTGVNDSTLNVNIPGVYEKGKYELLNFPYPPLGAPSIPPVLVLESSNPYMIKKDANGKLYATSGSGFFNPENQMWTSTDTGRNWIKERNLPAGRNYSEFTAWALDIAPNGKFLAMGAAGVVADSIPGGTWNSNYSTSPIAASHNSSDFADCNNGILAGGSSITVTEDGGKTWQDKNRPDFASSFYSIEGVVYPSLTKSYFAVTNGIIYTSADKGTTLDPSYSNFNYRMLGITNIGTDSVWAVANTSFDIPFDEGTSAIIRTFNGGNTWELIGGFPVGGEAPKISSISFGSHLVGYAAGSRNAVYKTINAGSTWTAINPFPSLNEAPSGFPFAYMDYTQVQAIDANTVFVIGNMFTDNGIKRVYKSTNGGTTWTDITGNIPALMPVGNLIGLKMHDANNGYITAGSHLFKTTDGGTTWTMDIAPVNNLFETLSFAPRTVPAGIDMANRKLFISGFSIFTGAAIMEYGVASSVNVNSTETITNTNCTNPNAGAIAVTASGGIAPYTYSLNGSAFQAANTFTGLAQGTYTLVVKDAYCGSLTKTISIGFTDNLTLTVSPVDTLVCAGAPVQLVATSAPNVSYAWSPANGLSSATIANPVATVNSNTTYTVTATLNTCVKTASVTISIKPNPVVNAGPDKTIVDGASVQLDGSATNATSVLWTPAATLTNANTFTPIAQPSVTTTYTMTVNNSDGCTSTDDAVVTVIPYCVKVMNAFTPNGDGINDLWMVTNGNACTSQVMVKVFNRYGSVVYENNNYQNDWDGKYKGKPVPDGTYYYAIQYRLISGRTVPVKGDVTILR